LEEYSIEAHLSTVVTAIQYSEKIHHTDEFAPNFEDDNDDSFFLLQNPTKTPIILKGFSLSASSLSNHPLGVSNVQQLKTLFLSMFNSFQTMEGKK
jgi:hypothetical protein